LPKLAPFNVDDEPLHLDDFFQVVCSVIHGDSPFTFEWLFQNETIENSVATKIENTKRRSILSIESVSHKHSGSYTCRVGNKAGFSFLTAALVVEGLLMNDIVMLIILEILILPPKFHENKSRLYFTVLPKLKQFNDDEEPLHLDDFYQLYCSVIHGDSPFTFQWLFQNKSIVEIYDIKVENSKQRSILSIDSVSGRHAGEYMCKVSNKAGYSSITTTLVVKGWLLTY
jgi:hypothetical protein